MNESILLSIKKLRGITEEYTIFDEDLIIDINTALAILTQLGVGPEEGFRITGASETWDQFIGDDPILSMVKSYVDIEVKILFDTPQSSSLTEALNRELSKLEWRINVAVDPKRKGA